MSVFAVLHVSTSSAASLGEKVSSVYPNDYLHLGAHIWLVADENVTTAQVCEKLGIGKGGVSDAMVIRFESYFGHASTAIWEWLKLKGVRP